MIQVIVTILVAVFTICVLSFQEWYEQIWTLVVCLPAFSLIYIFFRNVYTEIPVQAVPAEPQQVVLQQTPPVHPPLAASTPML